MGLYYKQAATQRVAALGQSERFNVSYAVPQGLDTGYRYLLEYYGAEQSGDFDDPLFQIEIPPVKANEVFGGIGLMIPNSFLDKDEVE